MLERLGIDYFDVFFGTTLTDHGLKMQKKTNTFEYVKKMKE